MCLWFFKCNANFYGSHKLFEKQKHLICELHSSCFCCDKIPNFTSIRRVENNKLMTQSLKWQSTVIWNSNSVRGMSRARGSQLDRKEREGERASSTLSLKIHTIKPSTDLHRIKNDAVSCAAHEEPDRHSAGPASQSHDSVLSVALI